MAERTVRIAAVGDNCMDVYEELGRAYPGGNPVNVAVYTLRLGGRASYTGAVGDDAYGRRMLDALGERGVDVSHVQVLPGTTAVTQVSLAGGERVLGDYDAGVLTQFRLREEDIAFLCQHDLVVSGLWGMIEDDLPRICAGGVPIAFDFADRYTDPVVDKAIGQVDIAFFASDEAQEAPIRALMRRMWARGPKLVVVTRGERGSIAYDGRVFTRFGIVPCPVVDTLGAGDSYIAGFLRGWLLGRPLCQCMQMGAANSSVTLQYPGAW